MLLLRSRSDPRYFPKCNRAIDMNGSQHLGSNEEQGLNLSPDKRSLTRLRAPLPDVGRQRRSRAVPELDRLVVAAAGEPATVRGEGQRRDAVVVAAQGRAQPSPRRIPDAHRLVLAAGDEGRALGRPAQRPTRPRGALEDVAP